MEYKILQSHIIFNHPHGDYIISVAIESAPGYWKAYYAQTTDLSIKSMHSVAASGIKYTKHRAEQVFPELTAQKIGDRLKCEN